MGEQQMTWHGPASYTSSSINKTSKFETFSRGVNMAFEEEASIISARNSLHARSHSMSESANTMSSRVNERKRTGLGVAVRIHPNDGVQMNGLRSNKPSGQQHHNMLGAIKDNEALSFSIPSSLTIATTSKTTIPDLVSTVNADAIDGNSAAVSEEVVLEPQFKHGYDDKIFDITKVASIDFANQITLLCLPVFKAIKPDELTCMGWTRKDKCQVSPNVVEFTKLFNNINFWVQEECLKERVLQRRADVLGHFVKIAKDLLKLNNIHGSMAVLAALQSEPIYRLKKTWALIGNRQHSYEKLCQIFNQENNRINLRNYMMHLKLPVIPYLGMYTNDLVYIDTMYPSTGEFESQSRKDQVNNLLRTLAEFQRSVYNINVKDYLLEYLQQKHYIEELQTFLDKENHETSLRLEPDQHHTVPLRRLTESFNSGLMTAKISRATRSREDLASASVQLRHPQRAFAPGHRKSKSLGSDLHSGSAQFLNLPPLLSCTDTTSSATSGNTSAVSCHSRNRNLVDDTPLNLNISAQCIQHKDSVHSAVTSAADQIGDDVIRRLYSPGKARFSEYDQHLTKDRFGHKRDTYSNRDAVAKDDFDSLCSGSSSQHVRTASMLAAAASSKASGQRVASIVRATSCSSSSRSKPHVEVATSDNKPRNKLQVHHKPVGSISPTQCTFEEPFICEGCVRRKTVMRAGRQIHANIYTRFWLALVWQEPLPILLYFDAKSWRGNERKDFKRNPSRVQNIADCLIVRGADAVTFQLVSVGTGLTYKFRFSESAYNGQPNLEHWVDEINMLIKKCKEPKDLISF